MLFSNSAQMKLFILTEICMHYIENNIILTLLVKYITEMTQITFMLGLHVPLQSCCFFPLQPVLSCWNVLIIFSI